MQCHSAFDSILEVDVRGRHGGCSGGHGRGIVTESECVFCRARCESNLRPESFDDENPKAKNV